MKPYSDMTDERLLKECKIGDVQKPTLELLQVVATRFKSKCEEVDGLLRAQENQGKTITSLRSELDDRARGILKQGEELKYIDGIVERGTGHKMQPDDTYRQRILRYVQHLEHQLSDALSLLRSAHSIAEREGKETNWEAFKKRVHEFLLAQSQEGK
jgi:hypothetical protein